MFGVCEIKFLQLFANHFYLVICIDFRNVLLQFSAIISGETTPQDCALEDGHGSVA